MTDEATVQNEEQQAGEVNTPEQPEAQQAEAPASDDWRSGITDEKLRSFSERFTSPVDAAKAALEFRQKLSNAISIPGKDASEDDIKEYRSRLGVPDSPDGYNLALPEDFDEGFAGGLAEKLHAVGATPDAAKAALEWAIERQQQQDESAIKNAEQAYEEAEQALRSEWGSDYDKNLEYAKRGARQFGGEDFMEFLEGAQVNGKPLGDHPMFAKVFAAIGRRMGEGGLHAALSNEDRQSTEQKMDELTSQAHEAMNSGNRALANKLFGQRDELAKEYYGQA